MREDLLGYLLGALEPDEMRRVEQMLRDNPELCQELAELERLIAPLSDAADPIEPTPAGLVQRTMANLPPMGSSVDNSPPEADFDQDGRELARNGSGPLGPLPTLRMSIEPSSKPTRRWADWAAGSLAAAVLLALLLPTLAEGRFAARRDACQDQLRRFGTAITQFVTINQQQRLPPVAQSGPEAFAGVYSIRLFEAGLLEDPSMRWCPSLVRERRADLEQELVDFDQLVASKSLHVVDADELVNWQRHSGGDYAYSLGVIDDEHYATPRYEGRSSFAVMSDAPTVTLVNSVVGEADIGHDGRGINVLYEDGRVLFVTLQSLQVMPDHPLWNDRGHVEAGVDIDDAVLAPSWRPPFLGAPQR